MTKYKLLDTQLWLLMLVVIVILTTSSSSAQTFTGDNLNTEFGGANGTPQSITSTASVDLIGTIGNNHQISNVLLNIEHTWVGDVIARLTAPSGNATLLLIQLEDELDGGDNFTNTIFEDGGADLDSGTAPFTGTFEPVGGQFSDIFQGESINGDWVLELEDRFAPEDDGTLINFQITFSELCPEEGFQTSITDVEAARVERPELINLYSNGSDTYSFGVGTENDLLLEAFEVEDVLSFGIDRIADRILLQRNGTTGQGPNGEERHILFFERDPAYTSSGQNDKRFTGGFFPTMEEALVCTCINRGADNVFANSAGTNANNIQRLDYIFDEGITVPDNPAEGGFPIFERGGNDPMKVAVIKELGGDGNPFEYGCVNSYVSADWQPTGFTLASSVLSGLPLDGGNLVETAFLGTQPISVIFVSFEDLGLQPGQQIFGYSLAGGDATTDPEEFLDFQNSNFFPTNTDESLGGLDLLSGGSFSRRAYVHTSSGWYNDEDPNEDNPTCDDLLTVTGGEANIFSSKTFKEISAINGSLNLNENTVDVCENVNTRFPFQVFNGTLRFSGTQPQKITGARQLFSIDSFILDNDQGLEVASPTEVFDYVLLEQGSVDVINDLIFRCDFSGENPKTAMIGPLPGDSMINGDVTTEQCFPARRAFRFVSPTVNTSTSMRANWQENPTAWDDDPNPGYGTHITGLFAESPTPTNDGVSGFDWQPSGNPSIFLYDNDQEQYSPLTSTLGNLNVGDAYRMMIRGSRSTDIRFNASSPSNTILRETGTIEKGSINVEKVPSNPVFNQPFLVPNPFQSIVDLATVFENSQNITRFVAIWDPTLGGSPIVGQSGGRGAFVVIDMLNSNSSNTTSDMNNLQQVKQAAFFYADGEGTPNVVFNEDDKQIFEDQTTVFSTMEESYLQISLYDQASFNNNDTADDGVRIDFVPNGNNLVDSNDALKISNQDENLARMFGNHLISYEQRDLPVDNEVLPLFINQYRDTDYVFEVNNVELPQGTKAFLRDNYLDTSTELPMGVSTISFTVDPSVSQSTAFHRFSIVFEVETLSIEDFERNSFSVYPNPLIGSDLYIEVDGLSGETALIEVFDTLGRRVKVYNEQVGSNGKIHLSNVQLNQGLYLVELTSGGEQYMAKFVKK